MSEQQKFEVAGVLAAIIGIEVEAVVGGCLQKITFVGNTNPASVGDMLRVLDSAAKVRDDFPARGQFGGKGRETKTARVLVITAQVRDSGKFISLTAQAPDGTDLTIAVSKKKADGWLDEVTKLGKLSEKTVAKIAAGFDGKKAVTAILSESEQFGANYFQMDDGGCFLDSMTADAPAIEG